MNYTTCHRKDDINSKAFVRLWLPCRLDEEHFDFIPLKVNIGVVNMRLNFNLLWGSNSVDLGNVQNPFIAITPRFILTRSVFSSLS